MHAHGARTATCALEVEVRWGDGELLASEHFRGVTQYNLRAQALRPGEAGFVVQPAWIDADEHTLITVHDSALVVHHLDGQLQTLQLSEQTFVELGPLLFRIAAAPPQFAPTAGGLLESLRARDHAWTAVSLGLHALLLGCMTLMPPKASSLSLDLMNEDMNYMRYLNTPVAREDEPLPWKPETPDASGETEGKKHALEEGQSGKETAVKTDKRMAVRGNASERVLARDPSTSEVKTAGILGVLAATHADIGPSSPFGSDNPVGYDPATAIGALLGRELGDNAGFGGLGMRGTGRGGGGDGQGTVGVGDLGTGEGARNAPGAIGAFGPRRTERVPRIRQPTPEVLGSLSKETIRRTIQRSLNQVRACYESALLSRPELSGRVAISFLIAPSGVVQSAVIKESSLGEQKVADCVAQAMRRLSFPAPDGGGYVRVTYPFSFSAD